MSKHAIIAIVVAVIIILGAGGAFIASKQISSNDEASTSSVIQESNDQANNSTYSSVVDALSSGKNTKCTFDASTDDGNTSGTIYISGDKARGDFQTTIDDETVSAHMIRNKETFLMWSDSQNTGVKMVSTIEEWADNAQSSNESNAQAFDPNTQVDFKCTSWTVDSKLFAEPIGIKFISLDNIIPSLIPDSESLPVNESDNTNQCSICQSLSGEAKNVCLQQFNCE